MKNKLYLLSICALMQGITFAQAPNINYTTPQTYTVGTAITPLQPANTGGAVAVNGLLAPFAGSAVDGIGTVASFDIPYGIALDTQGNIYVADTESNKIRKISPDGIVTTLAGSGYRSFADGTGTHASFNFPASVTVDANGNVYVADFGNNKIRKITSAGIVTTLAGSGSQGFADGNGMNASFNSPRATTVDALGNVYVADSSNNRIRKITPEGIVTTLAGTGSQGSTDGDGMTASFNSPWGIALDASGNVYVADTGNNKIRKISPSGIVTTLAGSGSQGNTDGAGSAASFRQPLGLKVDLSGNVFVADSNNYKIRKISATGVVTSLTAIGYSSDVAIDAQGNILVAYPSNRKIIKMDAAGVVTAIAGNNAIDGTAGSFNSPTALTTDSKGNVYVVDQDNNKIRKVTPEGFVSTFAGSGAIGSADGMGAGASFNSPYGVAIDAQDNLYIADTPNIIRKITPSGAVTTLTGSGYQSVTAVAVDTQGNVYVADGENSKIIKVTPEGVVTSLVKDGEIVLPFGLAVDFQGNIYVMEYQKTAIKKITPSGVVSIFAGSETSGSADGMDINASFSSLNGLATDSKGNIYVADIGNNKIRKITPAGLVTTVTDNVYDWVASSDGRVGIAVDFSGTIYVANIYDNKIRKIIPGYSISPKLPNGLSIDPATGVISGTPTVASPQTTYTVTATNNSASNTEAVSITINSVLGVEDIAFKDMVLYPNPTTGLVNISNVLVEKVNVYNTLGQLVNTITNKEASNGTSVQLNNLPTGIYYLHIETEKARTVKQVIKQ